ncbi:hypothetical protein PP182_12480 [Maribacter sp. PR1]|uniref:Anti-sigma factor n=1 Tax=Maribacter cobaltidurans TaxID=1178778 RepID=A0ABU7IVA8_9FLAO|nr:MULTISPECIES: hypothetical protein [Maribacter]MDC6389505.1 hypothetical protein [Maribacter sp. PR1]MEE1976894.1 hypothetical protein [Maribacter cobaltidurans]
MESDKVEKLIEKYFEASTTLAEEEKLKEYFSKQDIPTHLERYAPMFQYFAIAKEERFTKQVPLKPRRNFYKWASVAAVAVLAFGIYFGNDYRQQKQAEQEKALLAYNQTKKAFALLAENFNKGAEKVAYLNEFQEAKEKIYNNN